MNQHASPPPKKKGRWVNKNSPVYQQEVASLKEPLPHFSICHHVELQIFRTVTAAPRPRPSSS